MLKKYRTKEISTTPYPARDDTFMALLYRINCFKALIIRFMKVLHETVARQQSESLSCRDFVLPVFDCPYHRHGEFEIIRIIESRGRVLVGDYSGTFEPGQIYVFGSRLPHAFINAAETQRARSRCIQFDASTLSASFQSFPEFRMLDTVLYRARRGLLLIGSPITETVADSMDRIFEAHGMSRFIEFLRLLTMIDGNATLRELASDGYELQQPEQQITRLEKVLTFIHDNSGFELNIPDLARRACMSESALHRLFRQRMGCTPGAYILDVRLAIVARALIESDDSIAQIAFATGFNNLSNFNRRFQKRFQCSPRAYRRNMTGAPPSPGIP
jgi:AraC-like DNA-binding protein